MFTAGRSGIRRFLIHPSPKWPTLPSGKFLSSAQIQPKSSSTPPTDDEAAGKKEVTQESSKSPGIRIISTKVDKKLPKKEPLMKNMFMCRVDTDLLIYPEVFNYQDHPEVMEKVTPIRQALGNFEDIRQIDTQGEISESIWRKIGDLGLYGMNIPQHFGGLGYLVSDSLYTLEPLASEPALLMCLGIHHQVADAILKIGTDEQKQIYLPRLASGELLGSVALQETIDAEGSMFNTVATSDADETVWRISGEKLFVLNGRKANLLVVFAKTEGINYKGAKDETVTAFLVETDRDGVEKIPKDTREFGMRGSEGISVKFNNVEVSSRNILGTVGLGHEVGEEMVKLMRLQGGLAAIGMLKKLLVENAEYCIEKKPGGMGLVEVDLLKNRFSRITCDIYAIESMIYLTAGLLDMYDGQDVTLECGIIKNFSAMALSQAAGMVAGHRDSTIFAQGHVTERFLRDALQFQTQGEVLDSLRCLISLTGLQFLGKEMYETVKKVRNPLFHPSYIFKRLFTGQSFDKPKKFANLEHYLHLSVKPGVDAMELSIVRLHLLSEFLLGRYGTEIYQHQVDLQRLAEVATLCYAMFASVARASRSYCIGLRYADFEMHTATSICSHATERIIHLAEEIQHNQFFSHDVAHEKIGKQLFKSKGYFLEHPLTRNF